MDFQQLMQWRTQHHNHQSDHPLKQQQQHQPLDTKHDHQHQSPSALPLFLTEPPVSKLGNMSDSHMPSSTSKFPKMMMGTGGQTQQLQVQFSSAQWKELELQAVIFRYMLAGASVPAELLQPIKNSLLNSSSFFLHRFPPYQPADSSVCSSLQSGYWSRAGMDPEPGRCRRTDGKKWRCLRDVALGHKYCERHMNRGRNRSRKPVEKPKPRTALNPSPIECGNAGDGEVRKIGHPFMGSSKRDYRSFGGVPSIDGMLHLNQRSSDMSAASKDSFELSHGSVLRPFFNDWPRPLAETGSEGINASTSLSMSIQGNSASDVSLKLSTGSENEELNAERDGMQLNWKTQWGQHRAGPMGGPLAEALRSISHD